MTFSFRLFHDLIQPLFARIEQNLHSSLKEGLWDFDLFLYVLHFVFCDNEKCLLFCPSIILSVSLPNDSIDILFLSVVSFPFRLLMTCLSVHFFVLVLLIVLHDLSRSISSRDTMKQISVITVET